MEETNRKLRVVILPFLAMGHLIPFFEFSKRLAMKGVHISFFSTPGNIRRLPPIPPTLTPFIDFVPCMLSNIGNLPKTIENTADLPSEAARSLFDHAYAQFEHHLATFLADPFRPKPDWIIFDMVSSSWVPPVAARFGLSCALLSLFNAATRVFFGFSLDFDSPEELTRVPDCVPFPTTVTLRPFEAREVFPLVSKNPESSDNLPVDKAIQPGDLMLIRTCREFEAKWLDILIDTNSRCIPVVPVGFLPPSLNDVVESNAWVRIREWLDQWDARSVVYVAFGTEVKLTREQIGEVAVGLEQSGLAFLWALGAGSPPEGFEDQNAGRGLVLEGWVPQARLLAHPAIGGFLTHGGWNSIVESLTSGVAMAVLPMMLDQGLNARHLAETGYAVEVPRNGEDGYFSGEDIARTLRLAMVEEEGEEMRRRVRKGKEVFGSERVQEEYDVELVKILWEKRKTEPSI